MSEWVKSGRKLVWFACWWFSTHGGNFNLIMNSKCVDGIVFHVIEGFARNFAAECGFLLILLDFLVFIWFSGDFAWFAEFYFNFFVFNFFLVNFKVNVSMKTNICNFFASVSSKFLQFFIFMTAFERLLKMAFSYQLIQSFKIIKKFYQLTNNNLKS